MLHSLISGIVIGALGSLFGLNGKQCCLLAFAVGFFTALF